MADAYHLHGPCRRPAGKFVLAPRDSLEGFKGRASYLAENLGGRWSHQAGGYVLSPTAAHDFKTLFAAGFTGCLRLFRDSPAGFQHDAHGLRKFTRREAMRLATQEAAMT